MLHGIMTAFAQLSIGVRRTTVGLPEKLGNSHYTTSSLSPENTIARKKIFIDPAELEKRLQNPDLDALCDAAYLVVVKPKYHPLLSSAWENIQNKITADDLLKRPEIATTSGVQKSAALLIIQAACRNRNHDLVELSEQLCIKIRDAYKSKNLPNEYATTYDRLCEMVQNNMHLYHATGHLLQNRFYAPRFSALPTITSTDRVIENDNPSVAQPTKNRI